MMSKKTKHVSEETPAAAERVAGSKDLLIEILERLPAKSLIRFKLVSKQWVSLISDPQFSQSHVQRNNLTLSSGIFIYLSYESRETDFFWLESNQSPPSLAFLDGDGYKFKIWQSCSGLLLCRERYNSSSSSSSCRFCVCNPSTKQYRLLPPPDGTESGWSVSRTYFAFDPSVSLHYKVVRVEYHKDDSKWRFQVYSSHNHRWRPLLLNQFGLDCNTNCQTIYVGFKVFLFDLKSETLFQVQNQPSDIGFPCNLSASFPVRDDYSCKSCLRRCFSAADDNLHIIEMSRDFSKWVSKYRVSLCHLTPLYPEIAETNGSYNGKNDRAYRITALGVVNEHNSKGPELLLSIPGKIISYNIMKKTVKKLHDLPHFHNHYQILAYQFIESLSSV